MTSIAKRVIAAAARSEAYWKLSDAEKLIWVIEEAYRIGSQARLRIRVPKGRESRTVSHGHSESFSTSVNTRIPGE
jgi:hypothetical protein